MTSYRSAWVALFAFMVIFAGLFLATYPPLSGIEDEVGFINQALVWSRGAFSSEASGFAEVTDFGIPGRSPGVMDFVPVGDRHLPGRHPGRSLLLLPFLLIGGVRAGYLSGLLIHLGITLVGAHLLRRLGRSPLGAVLLLFHPTLALYSRTIMGDEAAGGCLLLATFFATLPGRRNAIFAGLSVGLAALMRYHAGLALPIIAASIALDAARDHRRRDGLACFLAGAACGLLIVVYNISLYHAVLDPVGAPRGQFGAQFLPHNLLFYILALMAFWPGMFLAPALDRTPIGGIARGISASYYLFFSTYYFHDQGNGLAETLVLGLRLMQVALPVWIVSYATFIEDRILLPLRRRTSNKMAFCSALVVAVILSLVVGLAFNKHQQHLRALESARECMIEQIPSGSVVVTHGASYKLFGVPSNGPNYRWLMFAYMEMPFDHSAVLNNFPEPWYLAILIKGDSTLSPATRQMIEQYKMQRVTTTPPNLILYRAAPSSTPVVP